MPASENALWLDLAALRADAGALPEKRVLVTGATGFLGASLVHALAALGTRTLFALHRASSDTRRLAGIACSHIEADLTDRTSLAVIPKEARPEVVFHCAAYGCTASQTDPDIIRRTNVDGTRNLIDALVSSGGCEVLVSTGSSSEYGPKPGLMKEGDPLEPTSDYGRSKATATRLCLASRLATAVVRPFSPYGPLDTPSRLVASSVERALRGEDLPLGSGRQPRDWIYVGDLLELFLLAATRPEARGHVWNGGTGVQGTVRGMVEAIVLSAARATGRRVEARWGALPDRPDEPTSWVADTTRAREVLGYRARTDLASGVARTIAFARRGGALVQA
jgi:nucleoside-diphosphate-sugar epimerase